MTCHVQIAAVAALLSLSARAGTAPATAVLPMQPGAQTLQSSADFRANLDTLAVVGFDSRPIAARAIEEINVIMNSRLTDSLK